MVKGWFGIQVLKGKNLYNQGIYLGYNKYLYYVQNSYLICQVQSIDVELMEFSTRFCEHLIIVHFEYLTNSLSIPEFLNFGLGLSSGKM